ncbi:MAG: hypothetical protein ACR2O4_15715, partial [Hyphomicrobiaceae bacterium]
MSIRLLAAGILAPLLFVAGDSVAVGDEEEATYELQVNITWSAATHPYEFPPNPHMSSLIGATHRGRYALFRDGDIASSGLELVAENGRT